MQYKLLIVALLGCLAMTSAVNVRHMVPGSSSSKHSSSGGGSSHASGGSGSGDHSPQPFEAVLKAIEHEVVHHVKEHKEGICTNVGKPHHPDWHGIKGHHLRPGNAVFLTRHGDKEHDELIKKFAHEHSGHTVIHVRGRCKEGSSSSGSKHHSSSSHGSSSSHRSSSHKGDMAGAFNEMTEGAEAADADDADGAIINEAAAPSAEDAEEGLSQDEVEDQDEALEFLELFESSSHHSSSKPGSSGPHSSSHKSSSGHSSSGSKAKNLHHCCVEGDKLECKKGGSSSSSHHSSSKPGSSGPHSSSHHSK